MCGCSQKKKKRFQILHGTLGSYCENCDGLVQLGLASVMTHLGALLLSFQLADALCWQHESAAQTTMTLKLAH